MLSVACACTPTLSSPRISMVTRAPWPTASSASCAAVRPPPTTTTCCPAKDTHAPGWLHAAAASDTDAAVPEARAAGSGPVLMLQAAPCTCSWPRPPWLVRCWVLLDGMEAKEADGESLPVSTAEVLSVPVLPSGAVIPAPQSLLLLLPSAVAAVAAACEAAWLTVLPAAALPMSACACACCCCLALRLLRGERGGLAGVHVHSSSPHTHEAGVLLLWPLPLLEKAAALEEARAVAVALVLSVRLWMDADGVRGSPL